MKLGACSRLQTRPETGTWFRALDPEYQSSPLATRHTTRQRSRFSADRKADPPFEVLYLGENPMVALWEVGSLFGDPLSPEKVVSHPGRSWLVIAVEVRLGQVADLTRVAQQQLLGTTAQELIGDWRGYVLRTSRTSVSEPIGIAPTQDLGAALFLIPGVESFLTPSARLPYYRNLIVFPTKLQPGSRVTFRPSESEEPHVLEPRPRRRRRS